VEFVRIYVQTMQYWEEIITSNNGYTIVLTGLGGQGLIKLIQILGDCLTRKGYKVISSEKHGLSQRGGTVRCYLRFGDNIAAPIPIKGSADMIIATEEACILEMLDFAKPDLSSKLIVADYEKKSIEKGYPSEKNIIKALKNVSKSVDLVSVMPIVSKYSNLKVINIILLAYITRYLPLSKKCLRKSLKKHFTGPNLELNQKIFIEGLDLE
jgi:indolepyruvate ferredoxin oxidoreductase beta subunit